MHCKYDNPVTMRREYWRDQKLEACYSLEQLIEARAHSNHPSDMLNGVPLWTNGKLVGDVAALPCAMQVAYLNHQKESS